MSKIARKHQKIFGGDLVANENIAEFGSLAEGTPEYSDDPDNIQVRTAYGNGFASSIIGNFAPCLQDFNALFFLITRQLAYLFQSGVSEWLSTTAYYIGSMVHDVDGNIYMSVSDTNLNQAFTVGTKWYPIISNYIYNITAWTGTYGQDYIVGSYEKLILIKMPRPTYTSTLNIRLPAPSALNVGRKITVKLGCALDNFTVYIYRFDGSYIDDHSSKSVASWESVSLISDGTNWHIV